jgi:Predicted metal-dependent hydrolase with the TIM-barrel fold
MKKFIFFSLFILVSCGDRVDLLVHNAKIYTANETFDISTSFVVKDGIFIDVGGEDLKDKYNPRSVVDAHGLTVVPGLIDAHCHFLQYGLESQQINLRGTKSFEEVIEIVKSFVYENNPKIVYGRYWDQNDWKIKGFPDKTELDKLFPDIPVVLERVDGHAYLVNQKDIGYLWYYS